MNHKTDMQALAERLRLLLSGDAMLAKTDFARATIEQAIAALAGQSAGVPDGWKLVPIEPTPEMVKAGSTSGGLGMDFHEWMGRINLAWRHILAAAPAPVSEPADMPEGCTPADAEMLRAANHALAAEIDRLRRRLRPFAQLASSPLSWAMVEYCIKDDPEKQTFQAPQMQRAFNRAAEALAENTEQQPLPTMVAADTSLIADLLEALKAVVSVADRATIEFDKARAAIERARTALNAGASPSRECVETKPYAWFVQTDDLLEFVGWKKPSDRPDAFPLNRECGERQLSEQQITDAVKKWFPDRSYQASFFARALLSKGV